MREYAAKVPFCVRFERAIYKIGGEIAMKKIVAQSVGTVPAYRNDAYGSFRGR